MFRKKFLKWNIKFSKLIVILVILMNILFAGAVFAVFWHTGNEPTELVRAWFAFTTIELWGLSKIKRKEIKEENKEKDGEF